MDQPNIVAASYSEESTRQFQAFQEGQPDYTPGAVKLSHLIEFQKTQPPPDFPTIDECYSVAEHTISLAIVYFCQILNTGYADPGNAARNDKVFREKHLDEIANDAFPNITDRNEFDRLCVELQDARNQMLGHADAKAFQISHGSQISRMNNTSDAWKNIDIQKWYDLLPCFCDAIDRQMTKYSTS